jgi:hypothetical protein
VFSGLNESRLLVLFSQDFTDIQDNQNILKVELQKRFKDAFYNFSVPSFSEDKEEYFKILSESCGLNDEVSSPSAWKRAMQLKLGKESKRFMLFVTDIENGNIELDKQFSSIVRSLVSEFSNFLVVFVGRKNLASLVYDKGDLSPLNTARELFFPDIQEEVDTDLIKRQFSSLGMYREQICKYLRKDTLGLHTTWSYNTVINILFWKNLLIKDGKKFVWRDSLTKEIGIYLFGCDSDVV